MNEKSYYTCGFAFKIIEPMCANDLEEPLSILRAFLKENDRAKVTKNDTCVEFTVERECTLVEEELELHKVVGQASVAIKDYLVDRKFLLPSVGASEDKPLHEPREGHEWCPKYAMGSVSPVGWYEVPINTYNFKHGCDCAPILGASRMKRKLSWIKTSEGRLINVKLISAIWISKGMTASEVISVVDGSTFTLYRGTAEKCQEAMDDLYTQFTLEETSTLEMNDEVGPWNPL